MKITKILCDVCLEEREVKPIACPVFVRTFDLATKKCIKSVRIKNIEICSSCLERATVLMQDEGSDKYVFTCDAIATPPEVIAREHEA